MGKGSGEKNVSGLGGGGDSLEKAGRDGRRMGEEGRCRGEERDEKKREKTGKNWER